MLSDLSLDIIYEKTQCDVASSFYLPCMREANRYYRITGYFSSSVYVIAFEALKDFLQNLGKIKILCSPVLTEEDKNALKLGVAAKTDVILSKSLEHEFHSLLESESADYAKLLSCLVSQDILDIRIAIKDDGLFHDKLGIFTDEFGNRVGFRGSMNETYKGLAHDGNTESVDVFTSFSDSRSDRARASRACSTFQDLWNNKNANVKVYSLPESFKHELLNVAKGSDLNELLANITNKKNLPRTTVPSGNWNHNKRILRPHQETALKNWEANNRRGILEHATGSGKTFTALIAIRESLLRGETPLIVVPSVDLLAQWYRELKYELSDFPVTMYQCGGGYSSWKKDLSTITQPSNKKPGDLVILSVLATAASPGFINEIQDGDHIFFVADEVHRCGSRKFSNIFSIQSGPRLGLSATPKRYGDPDGTSRIYKYFERTLEPVYTLNDAIRDQILTPYKYYPTTISLTQEEQDQWIAVSQEINQKYAIAKQSGNEGQLLSDSKFKNLLIKRSRIVKNAENKIAASVNILVQNYHSSEKWIVYCDNIDGQMDSLICCLKNTSLYEDVLIYHSKLSKIDRENTMKYFNTYGGIMLSVRCLDEGVDIPSVTHALILASSKNPREYIQRRGRVLRKYEGKNIAHIYDLLVTPVKSPLLNCPVDRRFSIIEAELARAIQFAEGSIFRKASSDLYNIAIEYGIDIDALKVGGYDLDDEEY